MSTGGIFSTQGDMTMPKQTDWPKFVQIASGKDGVLHGLDETGGVWKYRPAKGTRYAFWSKLTGQRADRSKPNA